MYRNNHLSTQTGTTSGPQRNTVCVPCSWTMWFFFCYLDSCLCLHCLMCDRWTGPNPVSRPDITLNEIKTEGRKWWIYYLKLNYKLNPETDLKENTRHSRCYRGSALFSSSAHQTCSHRFNVPPLLDLLKWRWITRMDGTIVSWTWPLVLYINSPKVTRSKEFEPVPLT